MTFRDEFQIREKTPKIHLVPPLDKDPKDYIGLYETIYREICDRLNHGSHIGGYVRSIDGIDLLNGEILDHDGRSLEGEVRDGKVYSGQRFQLAIVSEGKVSFGEAGYKYHNIPYIGGEDRKSKQSTDQPTDAEISADTLDNSSLNILEQIAGKYGFRVVCELTQPCIKEKYLSDAVKKARQNPQSDKFSWMYGDTNNSSQQTSVTPSYVMGNQREATQVYKK